jgi:hypothetical protein
MEPASRQNCHAVTLQCDQFQPLEPENLRVVSYFRKKYFYCFQKSNFRKIYQFLITGARINKYIMLVTVSHRTPAPVGMAAVLTAATNRRAVLGKKGTRGGYAQGSVAVALLNWTGFEGCGVLRRRFRLYFLFWRLQQCLMGEWRCNVTPWVTKYWILNSLFTFLAFTCTSTVCNTADISCLRVQTNAKGIFWAAHYWNSERKSQNCTPEDNNSRLDPLSGPGCFVLLPLSAVPTLVYSDILFD